MQLLQLGFNYKICELWKNRFVSEIVGEMMGSVTVMQWMLKSGWSSYLTALYICVGMVVLWTMLLYLVEGGVGGESAAGSPTQSSQMQVRNNNKSNQPHSTPTTKTTNTHLRQQWQQLYTIIVKLARISTELLMTILYLPILQVFTTIYDCSQDPLTNRTLHNIYQVQCYSSDYTIHLLFASLAILILIIALSTLFLLQFDNRFNTSNPIANLYPYNQFYLFIYKTLIVFIQAFFKAQTIIIAFYIILSHILFNSITNQNTYNNFLYYKIVNIMQTLNLWTAIVLIITLLTQDSLFDSSILIWILGSLTIITIIYFKNEYRLDIILMNSNELQKSHQYIQYLDYLIKLLAYYHNDQYLQILFDGFIVYHKSICWRNDCPAKKKFIKTKKFQKIFTDQNDTEFIIQLLHLFVQFYSIAINKFDDNPMLRIHHSLFLLDKFKQKQQALQELFIADNLNPNIIEQFMIYRLKKQIEIEIVIDQQGNNIKDQINELSYNNYVRLFKINVERSSNYHMEFWSQLLEDTPDLMKLNEFGNKLNILNNNISKYWCKLNEGQIQSWLMNIYGQYLLKILNDKEEYEKILVAMRNQQSQTVKSSSQTDLTQESIPLIFLSAEEENVGIIVNINQACASVFGFTKSELVGQKVNGIMPSMHSVFHDYILLDYLQTLDSNILNKERLFPSQNKTGYIFPVQVIVRHVISVVSGGQFVGQVRIERSIKNVCYLLVDTNDFNVQGISSSAINLLNINLQVMKAKIHISTIIPNFYLEIDSYLIKNGLISQVNTMHDENKVQLMIISAHSQVFRLQGLQGYLIKLEGINNTDISLYNRSIKTTRKKHRHIDQKKYFTMKYNPKLFGFQGIMKQGEMRINQLGIVQYKGQESEFSDYNNSHSDSFVQNATQINKTIMNDNKLLSKLEILNRKKKEESNGTVYVKINYGKGIRPMRLFKNQIYDADEYGFDKSSSDDEANERHRQKQNQMKVESGRSLKEEERDNNHNIFENRNVLNSFLDEHNRNNNQSTYRLRISVMVMILMLSVLSFCNYLIVDSQMTKVNSGYQLMASYSERESLMQTILNSVMQLNMVQLGLQKLSESQKQSLFKSQIQLLKEYSRQLSATHNLIVKESNMFSNPVISGLLNTNQVDLVSLENNNRIHHLYNINDATYQLIITLNKLAALNYNSLSLFDWSNPDYFFLHYNILNVYTLQLQSLTQQNIIQLSLLAKNNSSFIIIFFVLSFLIFLFSFLVLIPNYLHVINLQKEVVMIFLHININKVKLLFTNAENFILQLQLQNEEEISDQSDKEQEIDQDDDNQGFKQNKKNRKFKMQNNSQSKFFFQFFIVCIILQLYYIIDYQLTSQVSQNMQNFIQELNYTMSYEPQISLQNNIIKSMNLHSNIPIFTHNEFDIVLEQQNTIVDLIASLQNQFLKNKPNHSLQYINLYDAIMRQDTCIIFESVLQTTSYNNCANFAQGIFKQGIYIATDFQLYNFKNMYTLSFKYFDPINANLVYSIQDNIENSTLIFDVSSNNTYNNLVNIIQSQFSVDAVQFEQNYLFYIMNYQLQQLIKSIQSGFSSIQSFRVTLFIVNLILLFTVYILFWIPIFSQLQTTIQATKKMIIMIPMSVITSTNSIRQFLVQYFGLKD